ncbi:hypothetical protein GCM10010349_60730 [Streptomyces flavofungini]|nr:hypothetical protein GCM10010349_60730 [Streptomyces flavofungini]
MPPWGGMDLPRDPVPVPPALVALVALVLELPVAMARLSFPPVVGRWSCVSRDRWCVVRFTCPWCGVAPVRGQAVPSAVARAAK